jgi:hypothetical protein
MRRLVYLSLLAAFATSCSNSGSGEAKPADTASQAAAEEATAAPALAATFPDLFGYLEGQDSSFSTSRFSEEDLITGDTSMVNSIDTAGLKEYRPYLIYNPSRTYAIDAVTNSFVVRNRNGKTELVEGGPDTEVALLDFRNNRWKRIFFGGTMSAFLDARWENDSTFVFAHATMVGTDSIQPQITRYRIGDSTITRFSYTGALKANISSYAETQLNKK